VLDGYATRVVRTDDKAQKLDTEFSLEAWVALGAYPRNWASIAAQENTVSMNSNLDAICWPEDITVNSPRNGFFISASGPREQLGLHEGAGGWIVCQTEERIPLRRWTHMKAVFKQGRGVSLYIVGKKAAEIRGRFFPADGEDLRIGMSREKFEPSNPVRPFSMLPCLYSLDGIFDKLRIYNTALTDA